LSALKEGLLGLRRQRIKKDETTQTHLGPPHALTSLPIQAGMAKDNVHRSSKAISIGDLMRGLPLGLSPESLKALKEIESISAEGYKRILRIAGTMETREEFISSLPELLAEVGLKPPPGFLQLPPEPTSTANSGKERVGKQSDVASTSAFSRLWEHLKDKGSLGERLDVSSDTEGISHEEQAVRIGIARTTYFEVKAGRGGKKARRLAERYLRNLSTQKKTD
jgi:hypothetical protein